MGSDSAPQVLFKAILEAVELINSKDKFVVFATKEIADELNKKFHHPQILWHFSDEPIFMTDDPLFAIRKKKKSSMILGIKELKKKMIDVFISAGNTGSLVAAGTLYLKKFSKNTRPALLALLPTKKQPMAVIDVGGNLSCKANHLVQFAKMGVLYQSCALEIKHPKVGLLNVGTESKKGTQEVRQAYESLKFDQMSLSNEINALHIDFIGNIEADEVFEGKVDVLVTTGLTGNVLLKTAEGMASFIFDTFAKDQNLANSFSKEAFHSLYQKFNYAEYPGAILVGVDGIVIKCHGDSSAHAMYSSIKGAISLFQNQFLSKMKEKFSLN